MRKTTKVMLFGKGAGDTTPLPSSAYGLITLGIGAPGSITWLITGGLDANPVAPPGSAGMDAILVEADSVFAPRELVELEYTGNVLWADTRAPGEPGLLDRIVTAVKKAIRIA